MTEQVLRIGVLGTSRIAPFALLRPATQLEGVEVVGIASRSRVRAERVAKRWNIPNIFSDYEQLINDSNVDAIYNPLPNSLHAHWTIEALNAGKHVLCEKPIATGVEEAQAMLNAEKNSTAKLAEAFHYRYHPVTLRVLELLRKGTIGDVERIHCKFHFPLISSQDIRYQPELGGGATMDLGCYCIHQIRLYGGGEPHVIGAEAKVSSSGVDRLMQADFRFENGIEASMSCAFMSWDVFGISSTIEGSKGKIEVFNPIGPHVHHSIKVVSNQWWTEHVDAKSTYYYQLDAFRKHVLLGENMPTTGADSLNNMRIIDEVYKKAGLDFLAN